MLIHTAIIFAVGSVFALIFALLQPFSGINWRLTDQLFIPSELSPNIVVVSIDDESVAAFPPRPGYRELEPGKGQRYRHGHTLL